jgi:hypothetical protein
VHEEIGHGHHDRRKFQQDEEKLVDKLKHEVDVAREEMNHRHHDHPGFQTLLRDEELAVERTNDAHIHPEFQADTTPMNSKNVGASHEVRPGFQTLLKDEEQWVKDRAGQLGRSEFLRHRSQKVANARYRPIDDMPHTGIGWRSVPEFHFGGKGSFWHSMGKRNKEDLAVEDEDAQRTTRANGMEQAAEHQTKVQNPEDLHDASRSFGAHLVREVGSMSGWGRVQDDPDDDKPMMDMIEQMRAEYCSKRDGGPMNHKQCSKWMFDACKDETSGAGWCDKFKRDLTKYCAKHPDHKYCEGVKDTDGDGILDDIDVFPTNGEEWEDTDGDGIGNNADAFDDDPRKYLPEGPPAPGPPAAAPAPVPALQGPAAPPASAAPGAWPGSSNQKHEGIPYPEQGYNEYHRGQLAAHNDKQTWVGDWGGEWPWLDETHQESIAKACADEPNNDWCIRKARIEAQKYPEPKGILERLFR